MRKLRFLGSLLCGMVLLLASETVYAQNFWQQTNGPCCSQINSLVIAPNGDIFAGPILGGVFKSTDNGDSWTAASSGIGTWGVENLAVNSFGHVFGGTITGGVVRSTDSGRNWTHINNGMPASATVIALAINTKGYVFAAVYSGGIFRSTDNGETWNEVNNGLTSKEIYSFAISATGYILAGSTNGSVFRSADDGANWVNVSKGLGVSRISSLTISSFGDVFAGAQSDGVFRSTDNGENWTLVNGGVNTWIYSLTSDSSGNVYAGGGYGQVLQWKANGSSWQYLGIGLTRANVSSFTINSKGHIFAGSGEGVYRSSDQGKTWMSVNTGLKSSAVFSLVIDSTGSMFAGTNGGRVFRSSDRGENWIAAKNVVSNGWVNALLVLSSKYIYAGANQGVWRSADAGNSWDFMSYCGEAGQYTINALARNSSGYLFAATNGGGVFRSIDSGRTWTAYNVGLLRTNIGSLLVNSSDNVFAGTDWGVFQSKDGGVSWSSYSGVSSGLVTALATNSSGHIYAGASSGITRSTDNGQTWMAMNSSTAINDVNSIAINRLGYVFVATRNGGVFESTDNGTGWRTVNSGLVVTWVAALAIDSSGFLFAGNNGRGVLRSVHPTLMALPDIIVLSSPGDGSSGVSVTPVLTWSSEVNATTYHLQVSTDASFSSIVFDDTTITSTNRQLSSLTNETKYYWRVRGKNAVGYGRFSNVRSFTTIVARPSSPVVLSTPSDKSLKVALNPRVQWLVLNSATHYHLQLSTLQTFSAPVFDDTTLIQPSQQLAALQNNTTYYWRVRGKNAGGYGPYSSVWSFTTIVATPSSAATLSTPANAATNVAVTPTLSWSAVSDASNYHLQVSTLSSFASNVFDDTTLIMISKQIGPLQNSTLYYWRVRGQNDGGYGPFSPTWSFTTIVAAPSTAVTLTAPQDGATKVSIAPTLSWSTLSDAANYHLQVSTSPTFFATIINDTTLTVTTRQLSGLQSNTTYYWRMRGKNDGGYGPYSPVWSFTTIVALPATASLSSPSNAEVSVSITPTLAWGALSGATSYHLQVSASSSLTPTIVDDTVLSTTSRQVQGLQNSTLYYWRVRGKNDAGYGPFSSMWSFMTIVAAPSAVSLVSPANLAAGIAITPTLSWSAQTGATSYHLQVSASSNLTPTLLDDTTLTGTAKQLSTVQNNTAHYWRVRAKNAGGYGPYSPTWSFTTIPVYSPTIAATTSLAFPSKTNANEYTALDYRLIGLPGSSDILVKDIVTGVQNEDWEIVWDNGAASDYLKRYDGSAEFKFSVGRAFWIISKAPLSISRTVPSATLNAAQEAEIPVRSGWNLITNPFDKSIPWSRIQTTNGITGAIYSFTGAFNNFATFDPYAGYYFFNGAPSPTLTALRVPFSSIYGKVSELEEKKADGWRVVIEVRSQKTEDRMEHGEGSRQIADGRLEKIEIGVERDAKDGLDGYDQRMPRSLEKSGIYFDRAEWDNTYNEFGKDIKEETGRLKKWGFTVEGKLFAMRIISVNGVDDIPQSEEVLLVDRIRGVILNLRQKTEYMFEMVRGKMAFEILVGRREIVDEETKKLMPTEIKIGPNYPNPFNPETVIPLTLPAASLVKVAIYDVLGRQVKLLHDGQLSVGKYWLKWDGKDDYGTTVSSGAYFYRAQIGARSIVQGKMLLSR